MRKGTAAAKIGRFLRGTIMPSLASVVNKRVQYKKGVRAQRKLRAAKVNAMKPYAIIPHRVSHVVGQMSSSNFKLGAKVTPQVKALKRVGAPNVKVTQYPYQMPVPFGFQEQFSFSLYPMSDVRAMLNTLTSVSTGSKRMVLESAQSEVTMTNSSNASCEIEIYDLVLKHDLLVDPAFNVNALVYPVAPNPEQYWSVGTLAAEGAAAGTTPSPSTFIGSSPFDSQLFKDYFKVKKRTKVMLPQGGTHRHNIQLKPSRLIDEFQVATSVAGVAGLQGLTQYTMITCKGVPISDVTTALPTTASTLLDIIQSIRYKWTWVSDTTSTGYFVDSLTTPAAVNTAVLSLGSGLFGPVATA